MKTKPAKKPTAISPGVCISRRGFVGAATALGLCPVVGGESRPSAAPAKPLARDLSPAVQMQFMRPAQLEAAIRSFPVVYVPFAKFLYPDLVDLSALGDGPLAPDMKPPDGIGGLDPRQHASAEIGRRNVELAARALGKKARELLKGLPQDPRSSQPRAISPGHWWMI